MINPQSIDLKELEIMFKHFESKMPTQANAVKDKFKQFLADKLNRIEKKIDDRKQFVKDLNIIIYSKKLKEFMLYELEKSKQIIRKEFVKQ